jgi:hypothetical protein
MSQSFLSILVSVFNALGLVTFYLNPLQLAGLANVYFYVLTMTVDVSVASSFFSYILLICDYGLTFFTLLFGS